MYDNNYEEYIRSILGYPSRTNFDQNVMYNTGYQEPTQINTRNDLEEFYPEIYKIVNPMVCKVCEANTKPITKELLEQMTEEIYLNIESDPSKYISQVVNVKVNLPNQEEKRQNNINSPKVTTLKKENRVEEKTRTENRQMLRNNTLRDLIKILILNRLLGGNMRPPRPRPRPPRPPFPMRPEINPLPPRPQPRNGQDNFFF